MAEADPDGGPGPCDDEVPEDRHPAEDGRERCRFHHRKRRAFDARKSRANAAGEDVTTPEWDWKPPPRPPAAARSTPAMDPARWRAAAEAYEAVYGHGDLLASRAHRGKGLDPDETRALSKAVADLTFAMEPLLYGPGQAPDDAPGPPSEAPHVLGDTDPHVRWYPNEDPPDLSAVDVDSIRNR